MQHIAGCGRVDAALLSCRPQLLRPALQHRLRRGQPNLISQGLHHTLRRQYWCSAGDQDQASSEEDVRPEVSKAKLADEGSESEVPKLGLVGTVAVWILLVVSA